MTAAIPPKQSNEAFIAVVAAIVVAGLLAIAFLATSRGDDAAGDADGDAGTTIPIAEEQTGSIDIDGDPLPPMAEGTSVTDSATDPAAGAAAPALRGTGFDDGAVTITADGRPKMVLFLAHWCPHCRDEVPVVQGLIDEGRLPEGVDLYAVSTAVDGRERQLPTPAVADRRRARRDDRARRHRQLGVRRVRRVGLPLRRVSRRRRPDRGQDRRQPTGGADRRPVGAARRVVTFTVSPTGGRVG